MMWVVRTTITLDPDVDALVRRMMRERGIPFKEAVNEAIRAGIRPRGARTYDMGPPAIPLEKALRLAGDLEDEVLLRKLALRK